MVAPTQAGYLQWIRSIMGANSTVLPDDSPFIEMTYEIAHATVNTTLLGVNPLIYGLAVYNLGGDMLINWTPDQPGQEYFSLLRASFGTANWAPGVVTSTSDGGTSTSLTNPEFMKEFTMANLQNLKTPYGRQYLAWAQSTGSIWGMS